MKIKVKRDHLSSGLSQVLNVVGSRATMPILSNVLLEAKDGVLSLSTTNLDLGIRARIKAEVEEEGAITLPVRRFFNIIKELPSEDVVVATNPQNQARISSGASTFKIMGLGREEFPPLPDFETSAAITLDQAELATLLEQVAYAQSTDESRFVLNGVHVNFQQDKLTLAATDGRRLAVASRNAVVPAEAVGAVILPARAIIELARMLNKGMKVRLSYTPRRITFEIGVDNDNSGLAGSIFLYSKVVEGNFPDYARVIPKETGQRVTLEREPLLECVHRASLVCSEKSNTVTLKFSANLLEVLAQSPDFGAAHESLPIAYAGPDIQVAFNPFFILDPLRSLACDTVFLDVKDAASPGVIRTVENFLCVIMPVRSA